MLREIKNLERPAARMRESQLTSDVHGRRFATAGPKRHGMTQPVSAKEEEAVRFARDLAGLLDRERSRGRFQRLVLAAAPRFLGHLREGLSPGTSAVVTREYRKNWVRHDPAKIRRQLPEYL